MSNILSGIGVLYSYSTCKFSKNSAKVHAEQNISCQGYRPSLGKLLATNNELFTNQQTLGNFLICENAVVQRITKI